MSFIAANSILSAGGGQKFIVFTQAPIMSKPLLEIAKTGVEWAIKEDEAAATTWSNEQLDALGIHLSTVNK